MRAPILLRLWALSLVVLAAFTACGPSTSTEPPMRNIGEIRAASEAGNANAQFKLGWAYSNGDGVQKSSIEAATWYRKAAEQGNADAQRCLGIAYQQGDGVTKSLSQAADWYRKAAERGDSTAGFLLAEIYAFGEGVPRDIAEAVRLWRNAAENPNSIDVAKQKSKFRLGWAYASAEGVRKDLPEALKWYRQAAESGDPEAQTYLGDAYRNGWGVTPDLDESARWFRKAAESGYANAQLKLGYCLQNGLGVLTNSVEAVAWYTKAAEAGNPGAQATLGYCYATGDGIPKDAEKAVMWTRRAAEQGLVLAQKNLGVAFRDGEGVQKDRAESLRWYLKAAEQGDRGSQSLVGYAYAVGEGLAKDSVLAAKWYRKAAEQGEANAQRNLGVLYSQGEGVPKDNVEAYRWSNLAAAQGDENARRLRDFLEQMMSPSEIASAQSLSRGAVAPAKGPDLPSAKADQTAANAVPAGSGTGFFVTEDGWLVTNAHVVSGASSISIITAKGTLPATVIRRDDANDLALLRVTGTFAAVPVAPSKSLRLGQTVFTVGFPNPVLQGFSPKAAKGEIASLAGPQDDPKYFQISAPVQPGNSGGALMDSRGNAVGVVVARLDQRVALAATGELAENVGYAVKSSYLFSLIESVPDLGHGLKSPVNRDRSFEEVVADLEKASAVVVVYR